MELQALFVEQEVLNRALRLNLNLILRLILIRNLALILLVLQSYLFVQRTVPLSKIIFFMHFELVISIVLLNQPQIALHIKLIY